MFKNLLLIAWRSIKKEKIYSAINIIGLTIGLASATFLYLYIADEISYDRYHKQGDNIYRIISNIKEPDNAFTWAVVQIPMAEELRNNHSEVKDAVRFFGTPRTLYKQKEKQFYEEDFFLADSTVFDVFTYEVITGDLSTALDRPFTIVLTETIAKKYFNTTDVVGEAIINQQEETFEVTAVIKDVPFNSHFRFDALISRNTRPQNQGGWGGFGVYTYVIFDKGYDIANMQPIFEKIRKERVKPIFDQYGIDIQYELQKITDIHLYSKIQDEAEEGGDITYLWIFGSIAVFMLLIASINYMNLATARSANRAKEVGIRKVMGSGRTPLMAQFAVESLIMTFGALLISLLLIFILLPSFNDLSNKHLSFNQIFEPTIFLGLIAMSLFVGLIGGSYPAFYLSSFNPVAVLKGKLATRGGNALFRKTLVVLQFGISIFMLVSTFIVFSQLQYMRKKDLGFDKERIIRLELSNNMQAKADALLSSLKQNTNIETVGLTDATTGQGIGKTVMRVEDKEGKMVDRGVDLFVIDTQFIDAMGMDIVASRNFSKDNPADTLHAVLVNQAMVNRMSWDNPIGKRFSFAGDGNEQSPERLVIGVVKDYHQNSLYDAIEPLLIVLGNRLPYVVIRTKENFDVRQTLASIEQNWKSVYPDNPFEYQFLDQDFNSQYKADEKRSTIFTLFSTLTILIACLGLLGLAAYTTEQRAKEMGVRKVNGASVQSLVVLVAKEFIILVSIGLLLAIPFAYYFTDAWLGNFAYRIELLSQWPLLILAAVMAIVITFVTVGYHVMRMAMANPVKTLKEE
ncbi:MAG: ABC transporter permease [Cyclobacteriaceae bacterium]|nr:ABC transporter permease [Cyclobacteriaceae bacterium]